MNRRTSCVVLLLVFLQSIAVIVAQPTPVVAAEIWAGSGNTYTINRWDSDSNFLGSFAPPVSEQRVVTSLLVVGDEVWAGSGNTHTINRWDSDSNFLGSFAPPVGEQRVVTSLAFIPEPSALTLTACALLALVGCGWRSGDELGRPRCTEST